MKKILFVIAAIVFFVPFAAEAAGLYFFPQESKIWSGETIIIEVRLDTGVLAANAVEVLIDFPKEEASADFLIGGSAINLWIKKPEISNEKGTIWFIGGVTSSFAKDDILGRLVLRPKKEGTIKLIFNEASRVLLANGEGTPLRLENSEGVYIAIVRPLDLPEIYSGSHPNSDKWNPSPNLELRWDIKSGADYSYLLSKDPMAEPDATAENIVGGIEYFGLDDGIYYFHLREKLKSGEWGGKATYRAMIDINQPEPFEILLSKDKKMLENRHYIVFNTEDKASGINYYEVCEGKKDCQKAESPYVLKNQWLGEEIIVRAYDKAGHIRGRRIKPAMAVPAYIYIFAAMILLLIAIIIFIIIRRRKKHLTIDPSTSPR